MSFPATTLLFSVKIILISTGAISIAMAIKFSVPSIIAFTCYDLPTVWNGLLTWLRPPYLYFIVNCIIITIAASSRYSHHQQGNNSSVTSATPPPPSPEVLPATIALAERKAEPNTNVVEALPAPPPPPPPTEEEVYRYSEANVVEVKPVVVNGVQIEEADAGYNVANNDWMSSDSNSTLPQEIVALSTETELDSLLPVQANQKPLISSGFGHPKSIKTSPGGGRRPSRVASPTRHETMENTWKMITEGRHVPLTGQFKKLDTWENHGRQVVVSSLDHDFPEQHVLKSQTFRDRTNYDVPTVRAGRYSPIPGVMRREPSQSLDEFNRQVEAFIKKCNEDLRLQRQESIKKYREINRGAY